MELEWHLYAERWACLLSPGGPARRTSVTNGGVLVGGPGRRGVQRGEEGPLPSSFSELGGSRSMLKSAQLAAVTFPFGAPPPCPKVSTAPPPQGPIRNSSASQDGPQGWAPLPRAPGPAGSSPPSHPASHPAISISIWAGWEKAVHYRSVNDLAPLTTL